VVVSGERGGGNYYFAVDGTDPSNPKILWEWTDPAGRLGFTWSRPEIGWVRLNGQEKFVAFVGGGYSSTDNVGNTFYVVDIETGTKLRGFTDIGDNPIKYLLDQALIVTWMVARMSILQISMEPSGKSK
jgi:type IV pilus assembly protein PilY1